MELTKISGINEKREKDLNSLNIFDTADLIKYFPRKYLDLRSKQSLSCAYNNDIVLTTGKVVSQPVTQYFRRINAVKVVCEQEGVTFQITWYNQPYVAQKLTVGEEYLFYGRVRQEMFGVSMVNPSFEICSKAYRLKGIIPQYSLKGNLTQKAVRDAVRVAVDVEKPSSIIPYSIQQKYNLASLYWAYKQVHNPQDFNSLELASDRIAIEEYFALISAFKVIKGGKEVLRQNKYSVSKQEYIGFIKTAFPFEFTEGQASACDEIYADMLGSSSMNRLLQGDVGSGKTAVSITAMFIALKSGYQTAMLAPTEVLATQNYNIIKKVFSGYNVALLTGSLKAKEKTEIKKKLELGEIDVLVGTHAILQENVQFKNLSLCVCDEQQRFGVAQRSALMNKGITPDILVMSATPIPRTLSLIFYGDLDITTIKDKPKERLPIQTGIVPAHKYLDMLGFIEKEAKLGNQTYFVTPKIDGDEEGATTSATELYTELKEKMPSLTVGLLHGRLKDAEKNQIMQDFKDKKYMVLVSTTVIEVGVDVKDATIMVIHNAERFGLSQLHQLRGRVGRSDKKSYCFMLTRSVAPDALERINVLTKTNDGFKIAEFDYKLRGSGDFMGSRQSGKAITDLGYLSYSTEAIFLAKKISDECFEKGENLEQIKKIAIEKYNKIKDITLN